MTLIFNFCTLGAATVCFELFSRYFRYKETKIKATRDFYIGFFWVGSGYIFLSLPQFVLFDPFWIQIAFILVDVSFLVSMLFFVPTVVGLSDKWSRFKKTFFSSIFLWIAFYILFNTIFFSPATPLKRNSITYFWQSGTPWLQSMARGSLTIMTLILSTLFFSWAKRISGEKRISRRSLLDGLGILMITIAGFVLWFFPFLYFSPFLLIFSGCLGFLGFLTGWIGTGWIGGIVLRPVRKNNLR